MTISDLNLANSSLDVKASGCTINIEQDLKLPDGKSIAQLIDDNNEQKEKTK